MLRNSISLDRFEWERSSIAFCRSHEHHATTAAAALGCDLSLAVVCGGSPRITFCAEGGNRSNRVRSTAIFPSLHFAFLRVRVPANFPGTEFQQPDGQRSGVLAKFNTVRPAG